MAEHPIQESEISTRRRQVSFEDEYGAFWKKYRAEWHEKYVWD